MSKIKKSKNVIKQGPPPLLWVILGLGLLIKILHVAYDRSNPFFEPRLLDPDYYHKWALQVLQGDFVGEGVYYGLPLYPFFLAACYKVFGVSFVAVKAVQAVLGILTLFLIYKIGEKCVSRNVGLLAAALAAFYGPLFFHEAMFIPESLSLPLYAASFYGVLLFFEAPTIKKGLGLGALMALAALTKAGIIPFALLFLAVSFVRQIRTGQKKLVPHFFCLAAFLITIAPVTAHNLVYGKDTVVLTAHSGLNFYIGNNSKAEGVFVTPEGVGSNVESQKQDSRAIAEKALGRTLKPSEVSGYWSDKAWEFITQNPVSFLKLYFRKLLLFFDAREISDVADYVFVRNFNPFMKLPWLNFAILGPLFFVGLIAASGALKQRFPLYLWILCYLLSVLLFFINARYRLPLLSVFFPIAAAGLMECYRRIKEKAWVKVFLYSLVLLAGIGLTQTRLVGTVWSKDYLNAGDVYLEKKDYDRAIEFYQKAIEVDPKSSKVNLAMALVYTQTKQYDKSKEYYDRAIELDPNNSQAINNLGMWHERNGELEKAKRLFLKAIELKPSAFQAHNNLGMIYGKLGEGQSAIEEFKIALELNPNSARACTNMGLMMYRSGRIEEARAYWERALRIDPGFEEARRALKLLTATSAADIIKG